MQRLTKFVRARELQLGMCILMCASPCRGNIRERKRERERERERESFVALIYMLLLSHHLAATRSTIWKARDVILTDVIPTHSYSCIIYTRLQYAHVNF